MLRTLLVIILTSLLLLTACDTVSPATNSAALPLDNTFNGTNVLNGTATIRYPAAWTISGEIDTGLQFASQADLLQTRPEVLSGDQIVGGVAVVPAQLACSFGSGNQPVTPLTIMQAFLSVFTSNDVTFSEPVEITIGDRAGAQISGTSSSGDILFMAADSGTAFFIVFAASAPGGMGRYQATISQIAAQAVYTP